MKQSRIISLDHESYLLPENFSNEDALLLLKFLGGCRKIHSTLDYIPNKESRYATRAIVPSDRPLEVEIKITAAPVMSSELFHQAREAGLAEYLAAHPEESKA